MKTNNYIYKILVSILLLIVGLTLFFSVDLLQANPIFALGIKEKIYAIRITRWMALLCLFMILIVFFEKYTKTISAVFVLLTTLMIGYYISADISFVLVLPIIILIGIIIMFVYSKAKKYINLEPLCDYTLITFSFFFLALVPYYLYILFSNVFIPAFKAYSNANYSGDKTLNNYLIGLLSLWIFHYLILKIFNLINVKFKFFTKIKEGIKLMIKSEKLKEYVFHDFLNKIILVSFVMYGMMREELTYISMYFVLYSIFTEKNKIE